MGGALNAAALGHLGVVIGWTDEKVRAMFRVRQYLRYLGDARKPTIGLGNLLILGRKQAIEAFGSNCHCLTNAKADGRAVDCLAFGSVFV